MAETSDYGHVALDPSDVAFLKKITDDLSILADVSRADLMLCVRSGEDEATVVAHAQPHSSTPLYEESRVGTKLTSADYPEVIRGLKGNVHWEVVHTVNVRGATVARQVYPAADESGRLRAVLVKDSYWLAHERHRRRSKAFQDVLHNLLEMVLRGELVGAEELEPFGEHDGIVYVGVDRRIRYMSGVATGLYRRLGYRDSLLGRRISEMETVDHQIVSQAINEQRCVRQEDEQFGLTWMRQALPVSERVVSRLDRWISRFRTARQPEVRMQGVLLLVHDKTEALEARRELESKMSMIREVHHRVKNNLQVIASLMRMQARRVTSDEARAVLEESVNRVLSVAVVHEFLSQNASGTINLQEVAHRILSQSQQGLIDPNKRIRLLVEGSDIWLPAERATQCALVINELVQNAVEHGLGTQEQGLVQVELIDHGEEVSIFVVDNGVGLPEGFDLSTDANLGLRIVRSLVERDLRGKFELQSGEGTKAAVRFAKSVLGGA